jgi:hypothetical protein
MDTRRNTATVGTELADYSEASQSGGESSTRSSQGQTRLVRHAVPQGLGQFLHLLPLTVLVTQYGGAISKRYKHPTCVYFGD